MTATKKLMTMRVTNRWYRMKYRATKGVILKIASDA